MCVFVLHIKPFFSRHPAQPVSAPILHPRDTSSGHKLRHNRVLVRKEIRQRNPMPSYWVRRAQQTHASNSSTHVRTPGMLRYSYLENSLEFIVVASGWKADWSVRFNCFASLLVPDSQLCFAQPLLVPDWFNFHLFFACVLLSDVRVQSAFTCCAFAPAQHFTAKQRICLRNTRLSAPRSLIFWSAQRLSALAGGVFFLLRNVHHPAGEQCVRVLIAGFFVVVGEKHF